MIKLQSEDYIVVFTCSQLNKTFWFDQFYTNFTNFLGDVQGSNLTCESGKEPLFRYRSVAGEGTWRLEADDCDLDSGYDEIETVEESDSFVEKLAYDAVVERIDVYYEENAPCVALPGSDNRGPNNADSSTLETDTADGTSAHGANHWRLLAMVVSMQVVVLFDLG